MNSHYSMRAPQKILCWGSNKVFKIFTGNIETIIGLCKTQLVNELVTKAGKWQKQKLQ